jgi:hypothetical protein
LIIVTPVAAAFVLWALASWIIVGHPFESFTSVYGNSSQVHMAQHEGVASSLEYAQGWVYAATLALRRILILEPFALILLAIAGVVAFGRREPRVVAPLAMFGSVLAFMLVASLMGIIFGWLRFFIAVIPAATLIVGIILPGQPPARPQSVRAAKTRRPQRLLTIAGATALLSLAAAALPVAALGMTDRTVARSESDELTPILQLIRHPANPPAPLRRFLTEREVAQAVDSLGLGPGTVLIDTYVGYSIVVYSARPDQFIIPSDRDWKVVLADPAAAGVKYLLVPSPPDTGFVPLVALDDINRTYPGIYESGAGVGSLVRTFDTVGESANWRLYSVTPTSRAAAPGA